MTALYVLAVLAGLFLALVFMPIVYKTRAQLDGEATAKVWAAYFICYFAYEYTQGRSLYTLRLAGIKINLAKKAKHATQTKAKKPTEDAEKQAANPKDTKDVKKSNAKSGKKSGEKSIISLLTSPNLKTMISLAFKCLKKYKRVLTPWRISAEGVVGTGDPYTTGLLLGAYEAGAGMLRLRDRVRFAGDFEQAVFKADVNAYGYFTLAGLVRPLIWLLWQKPIRDEIKNIIWKK
jgi:hypothetical protein